MIRSIATTQLVPSETLNDVLDSKVPPGRTDDWEEG